MPGSQDIRLSDFTWKKLKAPPLSLSQPLLFLRLDLTVKFSSLTFLCFIDQTQNCFGLHHFINWDSYKEQKKKSSKSLKEKKKSRDVYCFWDYFSRAEIYLTQFQRPEVQNQGGKRQITPLSLPASGGSRRSLACGGIPPISTFILNGLPGLCLCMCFCFL